MQQKALELQPRGDAAIEHLQMQPIILQYAFTQPRMFLQLPTGASIVAHSKQSGL